MAFAGITDIARRGDINAAADGASLDRDQHRNTTVLDAADGILRSLAVLVGATPIGTAFEVCIIDITCIVCADDPFRRQRRQMNATKGIIQECLGLPVEGIALR